MGGSGSPGGLIADIVDMSTELIGGKGSKTIRQETKAAKYRQDIANEKENEKQKAYKKKKEEDEASFSSKKSAQDIARSGGRKGTLLTDATGVPTASTGKTLLGQ